MYANTRLIPNLMNQKTIKLIATMTQEWGQFKFNMKLNR